MHISTSAPNLPLNYIWYSEPQFWWLATNNSTTLSIHTILSLCWIIEEFPLVILAHGPLGPDHQNANESGQSLCLPSKVQWCIPIMWHFKQGSRDLPLRSQSPPILGKCPYHRLQHNNSWSRTGISFRLFRHPVPVPVPALEWRIGESVILC